MDAPDSARSRNASLVATSVWDDLHGASFTVVGLGRSGVSAANALHRRGALVLAIDDQPASALGTALQLLHPGVEVATGVSAAGPGGGPAGPVGRRGDIFVVSPGVMPHSRTYRALTGLAIAVVSEVELFYRLDRAARGGEGHPIVAISGTDGKTTTTLWAAHLLAAAGHRAVVAGNIGEPLCDVLDGLGDRDIVVAEVSAFQLFTCSRFRPRAAVVTNVAADHLDWFQGDMAAYVATKVKVGATQGPGDVLAINADDPELAPHRERLLRAAHATWLFSTAGVPAGGFGLDAGTLWWSPAADVRVPLVGQDELGQDGRFPIVGLHNVENALAASALALAIGVPLDAVRRGLRTFALPSHRIEPVGTIGGVRFIDDSKATNPHAALAGLASVLLVEGERLVWVGGGSSKDSEFGALADAVAAKAAAALLIGQTAAEIEAVLAGRIAVQRCDSIEGAVAAGFALAGPHGVVLLSPACASFDMFRGYAHRGEVFSEAVRQLAAAVAQRGGPSEQPSARGG
ncbi:MAG: UDP-N-acetylmuramoyl-L-alanine--D-glutamate ligase [Myxococcales bacterium]|nr:UDP-N-acetylmuramoyl-L-alanine--D-glutamate ligase [Myxococcales bacterium]